MQHLTWLSEKNNGDIVIIFQYSPLRTRKKTVVEFCERQMHKLVPRWGEEGGREREADEGEGVRMASQQ